jgi:membrane-associated phospholipid phosphatase
MLKTLCSILLTLFVISSVAQNSDIRILRKIYHPEKRSSDDFFRSVSETYPLVVIGAPVITGSMALLSKDEVLLLDALELGLSTTLALGSVSLTKHLVNRDRPFKTYPDIVAKISENGPSFPSNHTSASFNTATTLSLQHPKWYIIVPSYLWAGSVGYSRMHLGVHYPSDVFIGALTGAGSAWLTHRIRQWYDKRQQPKYEKKPIPSEKTF